MHEIIIFDLYDTVLKDISFDFNAGTAYLYNTFFSSVCSFKELKKYGETFLPLYEKRKYDNSEICISRDELPFFFENFGVSKPKNLSEIDYAVMNAMQKVTLIDEVRYTLNELYNKGVDMYILSNSIFTGESAMKLLDSFGILHFFKKVYSSADYGIRKPSSKFYQIAVDESLSKNNNLSIADILYVGNDYVTDVLGATSVGLNTVWYNVNHLPNKNNVDISNIDDFTKLLDIV